MIRCAQQEPRTAAEQKAELANRPDLRSKDAVLSRWPNGLNVIGTDTAANGWKTINERPQGSDYGRSLCGTNRDRDSAMYDG